MDKEQKQQQEQDQDYNAYFLYIYAIRSTVTKDVYLRRLRIFFNHIQLLSMNETMENRCNLFAEKSRLFDSGGKQNPKEKRIKKERMSKQILSNYYPNYWDGYLMY